VLMLTVCRCLSPLLTDNLSLAKAES
jgi:hypothetical protein